MAERIVDLVAKKHLRRFSKEFKKSQTEYIVLSGGKFENFDDVKNYINLIYKRIFEDKFSEKDAQYLVYNYGRQTRRHQNAFFRTGYDEKSRRKKSSWESK